MLAGQSGAYTLATPLEILHIPATVQAVLAARIDRLPADEKSLLQSAAVIGKDVAFPLLHATADLPEEELRRGLEHLRTAEFLYEISLFPDLEYTFKHALTHEVVYQSLLQDRRRALHSRIVGAIEQLYPDRWTEHVERLAHHAFRGEAWEKAVAFLHLAGRKAVERSAHRDATACFEQTFDALRHLPQQPEWRERAIDIHLDASRAQMTLGERAKSVDHARQAEALAEALGDERRLGRAIMVLAVRAWNWGDSDRGLDLGRRALAIAMRLNDSSLRTSADYLLGGIAQTRGDYRQSAEIFSRLAETLQGHRRDEGITRSLGSVASRAQFAWSLAELGEFTEAAARGREALRIAREVDHPGSLVYAYRSMGFVSLRSGDILQAIPSLEHAAELCRVAQVRILFDITAAHLGYAYALSGRPQEGVTLMEEALADPESTGSIHHSLLLAYLGEAHLLAGRRDEAAAIARRAADVAHRQKERGNEAWVLRLLGELAAHVDSPDLESAEGHYTQALARANELEMRPLQAHCHLGLGKLYRGIGDGVKSQEHLTTAARMYREMDMGFWREKADAELGAPHKTSP